MTLYTSPIIAFYFYRRIETLDVRFLGNFVVGLSVIYFVGLALRGVGRATNADYVRFQNILIKAQKAFNAENKVKTEILKLK